MKVERVGEVGPGEGKAGKRMDGLLDDDTGHALHSSVLDTTSA